MHPLGSLQNERDELQSEVRSHASSTNFNAIAPFPKNGAAVKVLADADVAYRVRVHLQM
jgi:hypothetical protein